MHMIYEKQQDDCVCHATVKKLKIHLYHLYSFFIQKITHVFVTVNKVATAFKQTSKFTHILKNKAMD